MWESGSEGGQRVTLMSCVRLLQYISTDLANLCMYILKSKCCNFGCEANHTRKYILHATNVFEMGKCNEIKQIRHSWERWLLAWPIYTTST